MPVKPGCLKVYSLVALGMTVAYHASNRHLFARSKITMNWLKLWQYLRSNPYFVGATSAVFGTGLNFFYDEVQAGSLDFSAAGLKKLAFIVVGSMITSLYHLYARKPASVASQSAPPAAMLFIALALGLVAPVAAQTTAPVVPTAPTAAPAATAPQNIYAFGPSWNVGGSPPVAGTALYAYQLPTNSDTWAFTVMDILPNTLKPFTVTDNIGIGIAQKAFTIGSVPIFIPTAAGISW